MEGAKKQSKVLFYLPGVVAICLSLAALGIETPDRTIRFGADFYTETYQAIASVAYVVKMAATFVLLALGAIALGWGMLEAKRSDLILEELGAIRAALQEAKATGVAASSGKAAPADAQHMVVDELVEEAPASPQVAVAEAIAAE